ncbi:MAG TPA: 1-acyl-sn-glycerol-3-phosphate acyltransferase [Cyclobacteriaceae bacterium]|nr:1-acyl-sn-glycerol-3-phosphate acyltransferase [Cyclobacteriaceae bacterium]
MRALSKFLLKLLGWKPAGAFPESIKKYVVIVAPHTSNWDFVIGLLFRKALRLEHARFLGKHQLFRPPFGFFFRWLGGYPVNRASSHNMVEQVVKIFDAHHAFVLALSPEGTRQRVDKLKTGFYNIARKANVPIVMVAFDYAHRQAIISPPLVTTDDEQADFKKILDFFRPIEGKHPQNGLMHL